MADKGLPEGDQAHPNGLICRFHWALGRMQRAMKLAKIGHGKGVRWRAVP